VVIRNYSIKRLMGNVGNVAYSTSLPACDRKSAPGQYPIASTCAFRAMGSFRTSHFWNNAPMPFCAFARGLEVELGLAWTGFAFDRAAEASAEIAE